MAKKHKLSTSMSFDCLVIGIASTLKDYKLCYHINKVLGIELNRFDNVPVFSSKTNSLVQFPFFRYYDTQFKINYFLIDNKNNQFQLMLADLKQLDYFLFIEGLPPFMNIESIITTLRKINAITLALQIETNKSKGIESVLLDIELYLLDLDCRKNQKPEQQF